MAVDKIRSACRTAHFMVSSPYIITSVGTARQIRAYIRIYACVCQCMQQSGWLISRKLHMFDIGRMYTRTHAGTINTQIPHTHLHTHTHTHLCQNVTTHTGTGARRAGDQFIYMHVWALRNRTLACASNICSRLTHAPLSAGVCARVRVRVYGVQKIVL